MGGALLWEDQRDRRAIINFDARLLGGKDVNGFSVKDKTSVVDGVTGEIIDAAAALCFVKAPVVFGATCFRTGPVAAGAKGATDRHHLADGAAVNQRFGVQMQGMVPKLKCLGEQDAIGLRRVNQCQRFGRGAGKGLFTEDRLDAARLG